MRTRETDSAQGLGGAAKSVSEHLSSILRLEMELATTELKRKIVALGLGIGLGLGAAVFLLLMLVFGLATIAAALATAMSVWLALLIMMGACFLIAGLLGTFAIMNIRKGTPPVPRQAIREAKLTGEALKSDGAGR
jgi:uncharacterized membrane protein